MRIIYLRCFSNLFCTTSTVTEKVEVAADLAADIYPPLTVLAAAPPHQWMPSKRVAAATAERPKLLHVLVGRTWRQTRRALRWARTGQAPWQAEVACADKRGGKWGGGSEAR